MSRLVQEDQALLRPTPPLQRGEATVARFFCRSPTGGTAQRLRAHRRRVMLQKQSSSFKRSTIGFCGDQALRVFCGRMTI
mmetsp:Transcript_80550/g.224120  ORF Transcript_80550/g.224120 Transcript_80550/m.224120 type:complete len:80 (+) Transcript_80550:185-424(+)